MTAETPCKDCGAGIPHGFNFCISCGRPNEFRPEFERSCKACNGRLGRDQLMVFADRILKPPAWVNEATASAPCRELHFTVQAMETGVRRHPAYGEELRRDPRWARACELMLMMRSLIEGTGIRFHDEFEVYMHACPHCGEADPIGAARLLRDLPEMRRVLQEVDDRPLVAVDDGRPPEATATCAKCGNANRASHRFCVRCGEKMPAPAEKPPPPRMVKREPLTCLKCGAVITPRAGFDFETRFFSGLRDDDDGVELENAARKAKGLPPLPPPPPPPPPPDKFAGRITISPGAEGRERLHELLTKGATSPPPPPLEPGSREERRLRIAAALADVPFGPHTRLLRAAEKPCRSCGEQDPFGIA